MKFFFPSRLVSAGSCSLPIPPNVQQSAEQIPRHYWVLALAVSLAALYILTRNRRQKSS